MASGDKAFTMRINLPPDRRASGVSRARKAVPPQPETAPPPAEDSLYHGLLQNLYDAAVITDPAGRITNANVRALDFLLFERQELCAMNIIGLISGADESLLQTILQNLENQRFTHIEGYCVRKDGTIFASEIVANRLRTAEQDQLVFFIRDITRRKAIEDELSRSEARNRALLNAVPDLMLRINADGVLLDCKASAHSGPMNLPDGATGQNLTAVFPQLAAPFMEHVRRALRENAAQIFEYELTADQQTRHYETRVGVSGTAEAIAIVRDITARRRAEKAEKERLERDLEIARAIQQHLLPSAYPTIQGVQVRAMNIAAMKVGGDYYDFIRVDDNHIGLAIADVSGKGMSGALIMAVCRSALRAKAAGICSPAVVLKEVNRAIQEDMSEDMFISMIYGVVNIASREFTFCRAGHEPLLLHRHAAGTDEFLAPRGMALGIDAGSVFDPILQEQTVALQSGDALVFYTDGITEAVNREGEEFGRERLTAAIRSFADRGAEEMTNGIEQSVRGFLGGHPQNDDITLMVVRV